MAFLSYFDVLNRGTCTYDLDLAKVRRRFHALQRQLHPDNFGGDAPEECQKAAEWSSFVNGAYETLRDPLLRAIYMVCGCIVLLC